MIENIYKSWRVAYLIMQCCLQNSRNSYEYIKNKYGKIIFMC